MYSLIYATKYWNERYNIFNFDPTFWMALNSDASPLRECDNLMTFWLLGAASPLNLSWIPAYSVAKWLTLKMREIR